jgi:NDP-sugar pyrophosphorylase family protein
MKAMILAAGLGTRLRPLTNDKPKALVEVGGMTLLEFAIRRLKQAGVRSMIINIHHFGQSIIDFLEAREYFGIDISISDERALLLDTGGALKKAASFFKDGAPFFLYNTDVITDLDLQQLYQAHLQSAPLATLALRKRSTSRYLLFDSRMKLQGWTNKKDGSFRWCKGVVEDTQEYAFSGIHVIDPRIFQRFPSASVFSIIDVYLSACRSGSILGFPHNDSAWIDAGKLDSLPEVEQLMARISLD